MSKIRRVFFFCCLIPVACTQNARPDNSSKVFFDLKGFFATQAAGLQKKDPLVDKYISKNTVKERRTLKIRSWVNELALFSGSDINKPAWKDSYAVTISGNRREYIARSPDLRTRKIIIDGPLAKPAHIFIQNEVSNSLFSSREELDYYPDSLYQIRKKQKILLIGNNDYFISGKLK